MYYIEYAWTLLPELNFKLDLYSAQLLNQYLKNHTNSIKLSTLMSKLKYRYTKAIVLMPSERLLTQLPLLKYILNENTLVTYVDSTINLLRIIPELPKPQLIISDLDCDISMLKELCNKYEHYRHDIALIVHAHGDNVNKLNIVQELSPTYIAGTCQYPIELEYVSYVPGFTDGDRTLLLLSRYFNQIIVLGADFNKPSNLVKKDRVDVKVKKLQVAKEILKELFLLNNIVIL